MPLAGICRAKHRQKSHVQLNTSPVTLNRVQSGQKVNWPLFASELLTLSIPLEVVLILEQSVPPGRPALHIATI
jgi:hypothetical protein